MLMTISAPAPKEEAPPPPEGGIMEDSLNISVSLYIQRFKISFAL
jgi:hypothetical protein